MKAQHHRGSDAQNPYAPPKADDAFVARSFEASELNIASRGRRFGNLIIDYVGFTMLSFFFGFILALLDQAESLDGVNSYLVGILVIFMYYVPMEALFGFTLGKLITRTRVVMADGSPPTFGAVLIRTLCRLIPFEPFSFLGGGESPVGWHDSLSKTRVVHVRD
jgi:uncharacterized RDD family membrane protein YckC